MSLPFYTADDVRAAVSMQEAISAMELAFSSISNGNAVVPQRINLPIDGFNAHHLSMPSYLKEGKYITIKLINVNHDNPSNGLDLINGVIVVMSAHNGESLALIDGQYVTALRTGAASGLATKLLSNPNASRAVIFGNGVQALTQIEAIRCVRDIQSIKIIGRNPSNVESFCAELDDAVSPGDINDLDNADIICTATSSPDPLIDYNQIPKGLHINAVGAHGPTKRELPTKLIQYSKVYVDSLSASHQEAGNLLIPINNNEYNWEKIEGEIGNLILSNISGRLNDNDITIFNSIGSAIQDLVISSLVMEANLYEKK